ncbi:MAG: VanZ family protein [Bacteroidota bacterium]
MKKIYQILPLVGFFFFVLWLIIEADLNRSNFISEIGHSIPWGDKIGHFSLFGILALLLNTAIRFRQISIFRRKFHLGSVIVFAFAIAEEFTQIAFSTRTFDLLDMLFDLVGIGVLSSVAFRKFLVQSLRSIASSLSRSFLLDKKQTLDKSS